MTPSPARLAVPALLALSLFAGTARPAFAQEALERGVERFRARDFAAAASALEQAHARDPRDDDTTLLLGISYYRLGRLNEAESLLRKAAQSRDGDVAANANLFLGLIADDRGDAAGARARLEAAARSPNPTLASAGRSLLEA